MMKKIEIKITEKKTNRTGLVVYGLPSKTGGRLKSAVLGGVNPSPSAANRMNPTADTLLGFIYCWKS
jgi:hypothetical protein